MTDYELVYLDKNGDKQTTKLTARNVDTAINNALELCPDAARIIRCTPAPMFND